MEGYEKEIVSLQRQQGEYDRLIAAYQTSGQKGSALREEKQESERRRLESYISERRDDIKAAEASKANLAKETDQTIVGERGRRVAEQKRLESVIQIRRQDITVLEDQKKDYKKEVDLRIEQELAKEAKANDRLAQLDAAVKVYRDKAELSRGRNQEGKRVAQEPSRRTRSLRATLAGITAAAQKARDDMDKRYKALDGRIALIQSEISEASLKITGLTTGGAEQADNVKTALQNLQEARGAVDDRIKSLESEIAEASRKLTALSETESVFGPDSSAELEAKKGELLAKKEQAESQILELEGKIRATDIGSFKFVARAFDSEVAAAEATENPILIKEATDKAVNRVVKWFILILVLVFDPLAVTLVVAYNASSFSSKDPEPDSPDESGEEDSASDRFLPFGEFTSHPCAGGVASGACRLWLTMVTVSVRPPLSTLPLPMLSPGPMAGPSPTFPSRRSESVPFPVSTDGGSRRAQDSFRLSNQARFFPGRLGLGSIFLQDQPGWSGLYFLQFPGMEYMEKRSSDVVFGLVLPIADQAKLKDFILRKLDLKSQNPIWKVVERDSPGFLSVQHKSAHVSLGLDEHCLVMLTSWWSDQPDPAFLDKELEQVFVSGGGAEVFSSSFSSKLSGNDYDLALALNGSNFFGKFKKTPEEEELFNQFREFLSFDLVLKAKASSGEISLDGEYAYEKPVLDSDFGLRVASKLDAVRDGSNSAVLSRAFGEFVEIFLQRLDYQTTIDLLERIDLTKSTGFEGFDSDSIETGSRVRGNSTGFFKMKVKSSQSGGDSLSLMIDLLVAALNPLGKTTANSSVSIQD